MTESTEGLQRQLDDIDEQIAQLSSDAADIPDEVGGQSDGALDSEDVAAALNNKEENDAIVDALRQRRESLVERMDSTT